MTYLIKDRSNSIDRAFGYSFYYKLTVSALRFRDKSAMILS